MVACRVTFEFYNKSSNGLCARKELSETVIVRGCRKCDILTEDGKQVQERFELLLFVEMGLTPVDVEEYDFHTVEVTEMDISENFWSEEDEEESEEEYEDEDSDEEDEDEEE